jgi:hypothetical protein
MSACNEQVFTGITPARWDCIREAMQGRTGVAITADSGAASKSGFTMRWNFDPVTQVLSVQCTEKPFIIPCSCNRIGAHGNCERLPISRRDFLLPGPYSYCHDLQIPPKIRKNSGNFRSTHDITGNRRG